MDETRRVKSAAIRRGETVYVGKRHDEIIMEMIQLGCEPPILTAEQGFVLSDGQFVDRETAAQVAWMGRRTWNTTVSTPKTHWEEPMAGETRYYRSKLTEVVHDTVTNGKLNDMWRWEPVAVVPLREYEALVALKARVEDDALARKASVCSYHNRRVRACPDCDEAEMGVSMYRRLLAPEPTRGEGERHG